MSRRLLNNPTLRAKIKKDFIPVGGAAEFLQPTRYGIKVTETSRWFQEKAHKALARFAPKNWWKQFKSFQGFYVMAADGATYHYQIVWKISPAAYLLKLEKALAKFRAAAPTSVKISEALIKDGQIPEANSKVSVLRVLNRVHAPKRPGNEAYQGIGRDHMWLYQKDVRQLIDCCKTLEKSVPMPPVFVGRLVRFHLVDNSRNISQSFSAKDVKKARFTMKLIEANDEQRSYSFKGEYSSEGKAESHGKGPFGVEGQLRGRITVDLAKAKITHFRAYGKAKAWGLPGTGSPKGHYPISFAILDVDAKDRTVVPPFAMSVGPSWRPLYQNPKIDLLK